MTDYHAKFCWEANRKLLTPRETGIPALTALGVYFNNAAQPPLEPHIHENCMEIVFLLKGFQVYEAGNSHFHLAGSDIFVTYPSELHSSGTNPEGVSDLIWLQIDLSENIPFFSLDRENADFLRHALLSLPRIFRGDTFLRTLLLSALESLSAKDTLSRLRGQQLAVCALLHLCHLSRKTFMPQMDAIGNAIAYIHDHIFSPISLEAVADSCGLSLSWFKVKFREETGTTPRDYINRVKLERAKKLLKQGLSVTETALQLGYSTSNYFAVIFRKYTGCTPSQYCNLPVASGSVSCIPPESAV